MTRLSGQHETRYVYAGSAVLAPHVLRLRPREDACQRLRKFELRISPEPQGQSWGADADGNAFLQVWWLGQTHHLLVRSRFEVEVQRSNPFDFLITPEADAIPPQFSEREKAVAAVYLLDSKAISVLSYAERIRAGAQAGSVGLLSLLAREIFGGIRQVIRESGSPFDPEETLRRGEGSCRDLAVLFNAVCRCWGIPARFVSGYECAAAQESHGYMHAWSEVYLPGIGWRGFDASRGIAIAEAHVAVAAARDPDAATPILGHFTGGAAQMQYTVSLREHSASGEDPRTIPSGGTDE